MNQRLNDFFFDISVFPLFPSFGGTKPSLRRQFQSKTKISLKKPIQDKMKKYLIATLVFVLLLTSCIQSGGTVSSDNSIFHQKITNDLIDILKVNHLEGYLDASILKAKQSNPDSKTNPIQTADDFYNYLDYISISMPTDLMYSKKYSSIFESIDQGFAYVYFLIDQPIDGLKSKNFFKNSLQYIPEVSKWLTRFIESYGEFLQSSKSFNSTVYQSVLSDSSFNMNKGWYQDNGAYTSFNLFLTRSLRNSTVRPITSFDDNKVVTSAVDATVEGTWSIDKKSQIKENFTLKKKKKGKKKKKVYEKFNVKSKVYTSIPEILKNSAFSKKFAKGNITHSVLSLSDYHHFHSPVKGIIKEINVVEGSNHYANSVVWNNDLSKYIVDSNFPTFETLDTRAYVVIDTGKYGLVSVVATGLGMRSSVKLLDNLTVGENVDKGQELGYFQFGGSDVMTIFEQKAKFKPTISPRTHLLMGEKIGEL
jgi:phosphatidylserine decarboxylase